jgi:excisionase family DNA binding protein
LVIQQTDIGKEVFEMNGMGIYQIRERNAKVSLPENRAEASELLKPGEVARILRIGRSLAYQLIKDGSLPAVRFHRTVRVRRGDLEAFIQEHRGNDSHRNQATIPWD